MSSIRDDLVRAQQAFARPTLELLRRPSGPLVVAVLTCVFAGQRTRVPADRLHSQVHGLLGELALHGHEVPDVPARDLCRGWVARQWLSLAASGEEGEEEYALTSHAQDAVEYVARLSGPRVLLGESRIRTILDTARRCATGARADREWRLQRLEEEIASLTVERDRLLAGGEVEEASDERMLGEYLNLQDLLSALPGDFLRVSEEVRRLHREIVSDFRAEQRPSGEVLDDYLRRSEEVLTGSLSGRAFAGAVDLVRDEETSRELHADIATILGHDFAGGLPAEQAATLERTMQTLVEGIEVVLEQRRLLSASLRSHVLRHDPLRDRELDDALRACAERLTDWFATTGPRTTLDVGVAAGVSRLDVASLRTRLHDPADDAAPPPLRRHGEDPAGGSSLSDLRRFGGPDFERLREALVRPPEDPAAGTGALFEGLPADLRRPADLMGLLHLAVAGGGGDPREARGRAVYATTRPDGVVHRFAGPDLPLPGPRPAPTAPHDPEEPHEEPDPPA
jgi:Protein of unknown function (DUF3375)